MLALHVFSCLSVAFSLSMSLIFMKRCLETFHSHSTVCSRVMCQQALFDYFQLVLKFCCFLEFDFNLNGWSVQNTTCDFFSFFSYLERTTQKSPSSLQRKLNVILSAWTALMCCEDSDFGWHLTLKKEGSSSNMELILSMLEYIWENGISVSSLS